MIEVCKTFLFWTPPATGLDQLLIMWRDPHDPIRPCQADLPGGACEEGEALREGAVREVREESGYHLNPDDLLEIVHPPLCPNRHGKVRRHVFMGRVRDPLFTLSEEHIAAGLYDLPRAREYLDHPFYGRVLDHIIYNALNTRV